MVKPHMVKKWAMPGTVHWRSFFWPGHLDQLRLQTCGDVLGPARHRRLAGGDEAPSQ